MNISKNIVQEFREYLRDLVEKKLNFFLEIKLNKDYQCNPALTPQLTHAVSSP